MRLGGPVAGVVALGAAAGCVDPLLPDEAVLGVDVPVTVTYGEADARFGASLAWNGVSLAVAAPGAGEVSVDGDAAAGPALAVAWAGERLVQLGRAGGTVDGVETPELDGARAVAASGDVIVAADKAGIQRISGWTVPLVGVEALATDGVRVAARVCGEGCVVAVLDAETGATLSADAALPAGEGGALAFTAAGLCSGDPALADDEGPGRVGCEDGTTLDGADGEHLGRALGGGYAAGNFDKWIVPPRARLLPLAGGTRLVLESGAEDQPLALAGDATHLFVGDPFHAHGGTPSGAVFAVSP